MNSEYLRKTGLQNASEEMRRDGSRKKGRDKNRRGFEICANDSGLLHCLEENRDRMQSVFIRIKLSAMRCVVRRGGGREPGLGGSEAGKTGGQNSIQATHEPGEVIRA